MAEPFLLGENQETQPQLNPGQRFSKWIGSLTEPIGKPLGEAGQYLGRALGDAVWPSQSDTLADVGRGVGESLPRTALDIGALAVKSPWVKAAGMLDLGLQNYEHSGSIPEAAASVVAPMVGGAVGTRVASKVSGAVGQSFNNPGVRSFIEKTIEKGGSMVGAATAAEAANVAAAAAHGESYDPFTPEHLIGTAASFLPWEVAGLHSTIRDPSMAARSRAEAMRGASAEAMVTATQAGKDSMLTSQRESPEAVQAPITQDAFEPMTSVDLAEPPSQMVDTQPLLDAFPKQTYSLDASGKKLGVEWEDAGFKPEELASGLDILAKNKRIASESFYDWVSRVSGVDTKLNQPNASDTLLRTTEEYFRNFLTNVMGMPPKEVEPRVRTALDIASLIGHTMGETRAIPASGDYSFFAPSRGRSTPNAFVALVHRGAPTATQEYFAQLHTFAHELIHGVFDQIAGTTFGKATPEQVANGQKILDSVKDLTQAEMGDSIMALMRGMVPGGAKSLLDFRANHYSEDMKGRMEFVADFGGLVTMGAASPRGHAAYKTAQELFSFTAPHVRDFIAGIFRDVSQVLGPLLDYAKQTLGWKPSTVKAIQDLHDGMKGMLRAKDEANNATEFFLQHSMALNATPSKPIASMDYNRMEHLVKNINAFVNEKNDPDFKEFIKGISTMVVPQIPEVDVESSAMNTMGYHEKKNILQLRFNTGKAYHYFDVPKEHHEGLANSESKGQYFQQYIRGKYEYKQIDESGPKKKYVVHTSERAPEEEYRPRGFGEKVAKNWWNTTNYLKPISQLARDLPKFVDVKNVARNLDSKMTEVTNEITANIRNPVTGKWDSKGFNRLKTDAGLSKAFTDITLRQNKEGLGEVLTSEEKKALPSYAALKPEDRAFLDEKLSQLGETMKRGAMVDYKYKKDEIAQMAASVVMSEDPTMRWQDARKAGVLLADAYLEQDRINGDMVKERPPDPQIATVSRNALAELQAHPKPEALVEAMKYVQGVDAAFKQFRDYRLGEWEGNDENGMALFPHKGGFFPEMRLGRWHIAWKDADGKEQYRAFESRKEFDKVLTGLQEQKTAHKINFLEWGDIEAREGQFKGLTPDYLSNLAALDKVIYDAPLAMFKRKGKTEELDALFRELSDRQPLIENPYMADRRFTGGREHLNIAEGALHYIGSLTNTIAHKLVKGDQRLLLADPGMQANPQIRMVAKKYLSEIIAPRGQEFKTLKSLAFLNFLGAKPTQFFVEMLQQPATHAPGLMRYGAGIGEAYKMTAQAIKDVAEAYLTKKGYANPEENAAIEYARVHGFFGKGWIQDVIDVEKDLGFVNERNVKLGTGVLSDAKTLLGNGLYWTLKWARKGYNVSVEWNNESAFLSSYRLFRKQGADNQTAINKARDLVEETMFGGGKANRPLWFLGASPGPNPGPTVGGMMYLLQSYTFGAIAQQTRYFREAIGASHLPPTERKAAMRGAASALLAQVAYAGVMGLPFSSQILALIEQFDATSEPRRRLRELFYGAGETLADQLRTGGLNIEDGQLGHFVSDAAMGGVLNTGPVDLSSRFQLGGLIGVDPYKGFSWDNALGPGVDLLSNWMVKTPQTAINEGLGKAVMQAIPFGSVRQAAQLAYDGWDVRNKDERLNMQLTSAEATMTALGFVPKRLAEFRQLNAMKMRAEAVTSLEQRRFHEEVADAVIRGDLSSATASLRQHAVETPDYDPREGARRVAELVQEKTLPFDPTREARSVGKSYAVGALFDRSASSGGISETERLTQKHQIVQSLGVRAPVTYAEMTEAQMVDRVMQQYPRISRAEAKEMVEKMVHPHRTQLINRFVQAGQ